MIFSTLLPNPHEPPELRVHELLSPIIATSRPSPASPLTPPNHPPRQRFPTLSQRDFRPSCRPPRRQFPPGPRPCKHTAPAHLLHPPFHLPNARPPTARSPTAPTARSPTAPTAAVPASRRSPPNPLHAPCRPAHSPLHPPHHSPRIATAGLLHRSTLPPEPPYPPPSHQPPPDPRPPPPRKRPPPIDAHPLNRPPTLPRSPLPRTPAHLIPANPDAPKPWYSASLDGTSSASPSD